MFHLHIVSVCDSSRSKNVISVLLGNSKHGNSAIISDCWVSYSFVLNSDFSLRASNRLKMGNESTLNYNETTCIETTLYKWSRHHLIWRMNSRAAIVGFHSNNLFTWYPIQRRRSTCTKVDFI